MKLSKLGIGKGEYLAPILEIAVATIAAFINVIFATISDIWKKDNVGRRTFWIYLGFGIYFFGTILVTISAIYPCMYFFKEQPSDEFLSFFNLSFGIYFVGYTFSEMGRMLMCLMINTYFLDYFEEEKQDDVNLVKTFTTGFGYILGYGAYIINALIVFDYNNSNTTSSYSSNSIGYEDSNTYDIINHTIVQIKQSGSILTFVIHIATIICMIIGVIFFHKASHSLGFAKNVDTQKQSEEVKEERNPIIKFFKALKDGHLMINHEVFCSYLTVFFGWMIWGSLVDNFHDMNREYIFPGKENVDIRFLLHGIDFTSVGIVMIIVSLILLIIIKKMKKNKNTILGYFTVFSFVVFMFLSIFFIFIVYSPQTQGEKTLNALSLSIPFIGVSFVMVAMESYPYSFLKHQTDEHYHGFLMSILHLFIHGGQFTVFLINIINKKAQPTSTPNNTNVWNSYSIILPLTFIASIVSLMFLKIKESIVDNPGSQEMVTDYPIENNESIGSMETVNQTDLSSNDIDYSNIDI